MIPFKMTKLLLALTLLALSPFACAQSATAAKSETMDNIVKRGKIIVGNEFVFPNFNFKNPVTGQNEGFMVDLAKALAKKMLGDENKVEFVHTDDATRLQFVVRGDVDMIIDTMPSSPEKAKLVDFSDETFRSGSALLVKKGSPIKSIDDIKKGTRVIYGKENLDVKFIRAKAPDATYIEFEKSNQAFAALKAGQGDVFTQVVTHLYRAASQDQDHNYVLTGRFTEKSYCIAIKKGDTVLRDYLNDFLKSLKASGEYDKIFQKWFGAYGGDAVR